MVLFFYIVFDLDYKILTIVLSGNILDGSNGDVAVDHYHRYKVSINKTSNEWPAFYFIPCCLSDIHWCGMEHAGWCFFIASLVAC